MARVMKIVGLISLGGVIGTISMALLFTAGQDIADAL